MQVKFKKLHPDAKTPSFNKPGDAGADLVAVSKSFTDLFFEYDTGIAVEIPEGFVGLVFPRSSLSNYRLSLANSVAVIDSNFRGTIKLRFKDTLGDPLSYEVGDRVGQLIVMPIPVVEFVEAEELSSTVRGEQGFGSSGK